MRQLGPDLWLQIGVMLLVVAALVALLGTIVITAALVRRFRRRVERSMHASGGAAPPTAEPGPPGAARGRLQVEEIAADRPRAASASPLVAETRRRRRRLAGIYAAAAGVYPLLLAAAWIATYGFSPERNRLLAFGLYYGLLLVVLGTPVALAAAMVLRRQPLFLLLAAAAPAVTLWIADAGVDGSLFRLWLLAAAAPATAVVLLNTRRLRAIGPVVFAATLLLLYGFVAGHVYAVLFALDAIGPVRFADPDLAHLPLQDATQEWLARSWQLPPEQRLGALAALIEAPFEVVRPANPDGATAPVKLAFAAIWLAGTAAGAAAAWAFLRRLARSYRARRASDQMLALDVLMLIFVLWLLLAHLDPARWPVAVGALLAFAGYRLLAGRALRHRRRTAPPPAPRTLLLLRVFGFERRTQRLLEELGHRWRHLGPIRLIGAADAAYGTIEPFEFFEFMNGRLSRAFVRDAADLDRRLADGTSAPDPDGLYRLDDFFCHEDTWRMTVARLARDASAVLMDLRGFSPANRGCVYEIEELVAAVPLERIVLLVDAMTDLPLLEQTLAGAWRTLPAGSPNAAAGEHRLRILTGSRRQSRTLTTLLGLLGESAETRPAPPATAAVAS